MTRAERIAALHQAAKERILVLDGSWGVMIQRRGLDEADFRADRFVAGNGYDEKHQMKGNNDILCITRPDVIADLHDQYFAAGADISETNTFSGTTIAQEDYALDAQAVWDINLEGAKLARAAADRWTEKEPNKPRFAAGSIGPLNKMLSMSSDVNDPGARSVTFDQVYEAYRHQVKALNQGGVDLYLIETITDNAELQGLHQGHQGPRRRRAGAPAYLDFRHHHRPVRPHPVGSDGRGLLELGASRQTVRRRLQLCARRRPDAPLHRRIEPRRRHPGRRLSQRGPAQRHGSVRRRTARNRPFHRGMGRLRPGQHRRRLLRARRRITSDTSPKKSRR